MELSDQERAARVADWFARARAEWDLNLSAVARRAGISRDTVQAIAEGKHKQGYSYLTSTETLEKLCRGMATRGLDDRLDEALARRFYFEALVAKGTLPEDDPQAVVRLEALLRDNPDVAAVLDIVRSRKPLSISDVESIEALLPSIRDWLRDQGQARSA